MILGSGLQSHCGSEGGKPKGLRCASREEGLLQGDGLDEAVGVKGSFSSPDPNPDLNPNPCVWEKEQTPREAVQGAQGWDTASLAAGLSGAYTDDPARPIPSGHICSQPHLLGFWSHIIFQLIPDFAPS